MDGNRRTPPLNKNWLGGGEFACDEIQSIAHFSLKSSLSFFSSGEKPT